MNKIFCSVIIAGFILFFQGCTKDADVKLPVVESKLVINAFISPQDSIIKVMVSLSQPLYNNSNSGLYPNVENATVQISDGVNSITLIYNSADNYYSINASQFPIVAGGIYNLTVYTPDGKNVNASTSVPAPNSSLSFSANNINDPNQPETYSINATWNDSPGIEDYYRINYYSKQFYDGDIDTSYYSQFSEHYTDKENDGKTFNQYFEVYKMNSTGSAGELYLIRATKEYYLYHTKLMEAINSGGPFSEPVQMFTNINGGYGIFAGFNQYKLQVFL